MKPRKWHGDRASALLAAVFFIFLYIDTGTLNKMEEQVERSVAALPAGHRVVEDIESMENSRVVIEHIVDRACIGRCFSYDNYEPPTALFRVRAAPGNSIVYVADASESGARSDEGARGSAREGAQSARLRNFPMRARTASNICVRELSPDEIGALVEGKFEY